MTRVNYIISISPGILREEKSRGMQMLERRLGPILQLSDPWKLYSWGLPQEEINEKVYRAQGSEARLLTSNEYEQLKTLFNLERRILRIYKSEEIR